MNDDFDTPYAQLSPHEVHCARQRLALAHAALFPTRMALARWCSGTGPVLPDDQSRLQAAWLARIGRDHQAWLNRGGFAQHDDLPPLCQPTMWHPPRLASHLPPQAMDDLTDQSSKIDLQHPSHRTGRDDDTRECGSIT